MGYIKQPKGVDFIIQSKPLTDEEGKVISKLIQDYKAKPADKSYKKTRTTSSKQKLLALQKSTATNTRFAAMLA